MYFNQYGPTLYITYDESTGQYRVGETANGLRGRTGTRSQNLGGRGWPKSEKVIVNLPAPTDKRERMIIETALINHLLSLGLPLKNRKQLWSDKRLLSHQDLISRWLSSLDSLKDKF